MRRAPAMRSSSVPAAAPALDAAAGADDGVLARNQPTTPTAAPSATASAPIRHAARGARSVRGRSDRVVATGGSLVPTLVAAPSPVTGAIAGPASGAGGSGGG